MVLDVMDVEVAHKKSNKQDIFALDADQIRIHEVIILISVLHVAKHISKEKIKKLYPL
jgi:hypothetical protein